MLGIGARNLKCCRSGRRQDGILGDKNYEIQLDSGGWLLTKKIQATNVTSAHIVGERKDQQQRPNVQPVISAVHRRSRR
jgi:hypothetical protein